MKWIGAILTMMILYGLTVHILLGNMGDRFDYHELRWWLEDWCYTGVME